MTIDAVAVNDPVEAGAMNQLIQNVNGSPGRQVFTANGTFTVPQGVHQFRVTLCGAGGASGDPGSYTASEENFATAGGAGGIGPLASVIVSGQDVGSNFAVTVGAGGTGAGGTTSFGALLSSSGGAKGGTGPSAPGSGTPGANGTLSGSLFGVALRHGNDLYVNASLVGYGTGGVPSTLVSNNGIDGIVVVEW